MHRDRIAGHWKQTKGRARKATGRWASSEREGDAVARPRVRHDKLQAAGGMRGDEARRRPRELPSR